MRVAIVDYGAGNMRSVANALARAGAEPVFAGTPEAIAASDRLVLPGVGACGEAVANLRARGLDTALDEAVRRRGRPMLAICVGMQILAERLMEFGSHRGLGWIAGDVTPLSGRLAPDVRVPHMGWNAVETAPAAARFFADLRPDRAFYFCHSFALSPEADPWVVATASHGGVVRAGVLRDTVFAVQFHPEKSQINGERLLTAFCAWKP